jgi:hypothetical protein
VGTNTTSLKLIKLLLNSVLSYPAAGFSSINLKNFYLNTPMPDPEYVHIKIADILAELIEEYKLKVTSMTVGFTSKFAWAVMAFPRPTFSPTIFSNPAFLLKDITKPNPPLASGATNGVPSNSI